MKTNSTTRTRLTSALVAGALGLTIAVAAPLSPADAAPPTDGLSLWYPLQNDTGTVIADASGNNKNGTLVGGGATEGAAGLKFSGTNYVTMPNNLITGLSAVSVSAEVLIDPTLNAGGNYFFYNLGNRIDPGNTGAAQGYLFSSDSANTYKARISPSHWTTEQAASRPGALPRSKWMNVAFTFDGPVMVLYLDGVEVARNSAMTYSPKDIGLDPNGETNYNALARSGYINDVMFKGRMRDFRLYTRALTGAEVAEINAFNAPVSLASDVAALTLGDTTKVTANLTLPATGPYGSALTWSSANPGLVSNTGVITQPASAPASTTLTATLTGRTGTTQAKTFTVTVLPQATPAERAQAAVDAVVVHNADDARGNLTLPTVAGTEGTVITWSSSNPAVVSTTGEVTRPATGSADATVQLTATATVDGATATRVISVKVPALPATPDFEGYLFSYFIGEGYANGEQVYFGLSKGNDPLNYQNLNNNQPVLTSTLGEQGLRDPFIIRSPEGDKFYQIATDLKIYGNGNWDAAQRTGSKSIMVWESTDLVNWTDQRLVKVSPDTAGNTWAPEAYYDETIGAYVVFWASKLYAESDPNHTGSTYNRMMYSTTRDFHTFTPAQVWIDPGYSVIDSTVIKEGENYYRFTKDERNNTSSTPCSKFILGEKSPELRSTDYEFITDCIGKGQIGQGEGPTIFKDNEAEKWYMFIDEFGGRGYVPFETTNLDGDTTAWTVPASYTMPSRPRHGTVLPVTQEEYNRLLQAYQPNALVSEIAPVAVATQIGQAPSLPTRVNVTFADGTTGTANVTWDVVDPASYAESGSFTVTGVVPTAPGKTATATVYVIAPQCVQQGHITAAPGIVPSLPTTVQVQGSDPEQGLATAPVIWDEVTAEDVAELGEVIVTGIATLADGRETAVELVISVLPAAPAPMPDQPTLSATYTEGSYSVTRLQNGNLTDKGWSNWRSGTKNLTDTITATYSSARDIVSAKWYFYADGSSLSWPSSVQAQAWIDGAWVNQGQPITVGGTAGQAPIVDVPINAFTDRVRFVLTARDNTHMQASELTFTGLGIDSEVPERTLECAPIGFPTPTVTVTVTATPTSTATVTAEPTSTATVTAEPTSTATVTAQPTSTATVTGEPTATATVTAEPTSTATATAPTQTVTVTVQPTPGGGGSTPPPTSPSTSPSASPSATVSPSIIYDHYTTPGYHLVGGRQWYTTCEPFSLTIRCRTDIWATTVTQVNGVFVQKTGWVFNNMTYLPFMTKAQWGSSFMANSGTYTISGRQWRTECGTPATGASACRSYIWASYIASEKLANGSYRYFWTSGWLLNHIVRFAA